MAPVNRWLRPENQDVVQRSIKICHVIPKVYCARYQAVPEGSPVQCPHRIIIPIWGDFLTIIKVYPLFVAVGTVVGICVMQLVRNITTNPDVRVLKEKRTAGVLDNLAEGQKYKEHGLRKYVRNKKPQIMPSVNDFFSKPE